MNEKTNEAKTPGPINRQGLYAYVSQYTKEAIDVLVEIMRTTRNESLKLGAAKAIIDKNLPDVKAVEITGQDGGPIRVQLINNYLSTFDGNVSTSTGSSAGQDAVQSSGVAPESKKDDDSPGESGSGGAQPAP